MALKFIAKNRKQLVIVISITLLNIIFNCRAYFFPDTLSEVNVSRNYPRFVANNSKICPPIRAKESFEVPTPLNTNKYKIDIVNREKVPVCKRPWKNNRVFMLETMRDYVIPKNLCALESIARYIGNEWCVVLFVIGLNEEKTTTEQKKLLNNYENIAIENIDPNEAVEGSPFEGIFKTDRFLRSSLKHLTGIHYSDILRAALLYGYGGIYVDADIIALKSIDLAPEYLVRTGQGGIANGIMKFNRWNFMLMRYVANIWTDYAPEHYSRLFYVLLEAVEDHCKHMGLSVKGKETVTE